jgi:transketolase
LVYVLLGDGECDEGSVWEAAMAAAQFQLGNLTAIVDCNKIQYDAATTDIMSLGDLAGKWESFGWEVAEIDGHSITSIFDALYEKPRDSSKPYMLIANTIKGKGVSFMENKPEWHFGRLSQSQYEVAISEQNT